MHKEIVRGSTKRSWFGVSNGGEESRKTFRFLDTQERRILVSDVGKGERGNLWKAQEGWHTQFRALRCWVCPSAPVEEGSRPLDRSWLGVLCEEGTVEVSEG